MVNYQRLSDTLAAPGSFTPTDPTNDAANSRADDAEHTGDFNMAGPSLKKPVSSRASPTERAHPALVAGMQEDYYNRIFVIPSIIDIRNPVIGAEQAYSLWNAFLSSNTLTTINTTGADGLTNTASPPVVFEALELKPYGIIVGPTAPISIAAEFTFIFTVGEGTLNFLAERATVLSYKPNEPTVQRFEFKTDILRSYDGTEQRIALRPEPREKLEYNILLENEVEMREMKNSLFNGLGSPIVLPLWHEPVEITVDVGVAVVEIFGDFSQSDIVAEDFIYIESADESTSELARVASITSTKITVDNTLDNTYSIGDVVYSTRIVQRPDNSSMGRFLVNAGRLPVNGESIELRDIGGTGATVDTYASLPVLTYRPSYRGAPAEESYRLNYERIDYADNNFLIQYGATFPNIIQPRSFYLQRVTPDDFQYWKKFLMTVQGRREPFLAPTWRPDLTLDSIPVVGVGEMDIRTDEGVNYGSDYFASEAHKMLQIETGLGNIGYVTVDTTEDNLDGTMTLTLTATVPDVDGTGTLSEPVMLSFLEKVRLASDEVVFQHFSAYSRIEVGLETIQG